MGSQTACLNVPQTCGTARFHVIIHGFPYQLRTQNMEAERINQITNALDSLEQRSRDIRGYL